MNQEENLKSTRSGRGAWAHCATQGRSKRGRLAGAGLILGLLAASQVCMANEAPNAVTAQTKLLEHSIEAWGTVLDAETGQPIRDVRLKVTVGYLDESTASFRRTERSRQRIDGAFHFRCEACLDARLRFFAEGYRSEALDLHALSSTHTRRPAQPSSFDVMLEPLREPVKLHNFRGRLVVGADPAESQVLLLTEAGGLSLSKEQSRQQVEKTGAPLRYLELRTPTDAKGQPEAAPREKGRHYLKATAASVDFSSADGGVIPVPAEGHSDPTLRRTMTEAPADGYAPILDLDLASRRSTYFYVRIADRYGRGMISAPVLERTSEGRRLVATIELDLNPDGTRRLTTAD